MNSSGICVWLSFVVVNIDIVGMVFCMFYDVIVVLVSKCLNVVVFGWWLKYRLMKVCLLLRCVFRFVVFMLWYMFG